DWIIGEECVASGNGPRHRQAVAFLQAVVQRHVHHGFTAVRTRHSADDGTDWLWRCSLALTRGLGRWFLGAPTRQDRARDHRLRRLRNDTGPHGTFVFVEGLHLAVHLSSTNQLYASCGPH